MKLHLFIHLFICFLCFTAKAQSDFRPGVVVTLENDTLQGFVAFQSNKNNFISCRFKPSAEAKVIIYTPADILAYGFVNGRWYGSKLLPGLSEYSNRYFFQVLVQGEVSLLYYRDRFFLQKTDPDLLQELTTRKEERDFNGKKQVITVKMYLALLYKLIEKCEHDIISAEDITKSSLSLSSLIPLFEKINQCQNADYLVYQSTLPWLKVKTVLFGGINMSNLNHIGKGEPPSAKFLSFSSFNTAIRSTGGIGLNFSSPRITERLSGQLELWYAENKYEGYSEIMSSVPPTTERNNIYITAQTIKIPLLFTYSHPVGSLKLHYRAGFSNNVHLKINTRRVIETQNEQVVYTRYTDFAPILGYHTGFCGGIGISQRIKNKLDIMLETRYERADATFKYYGQLANVKGDNSNFTFFLGISF